LIGEGEGLLEEGHGLEVNVLEMIMLEVVPSRGDSFDDSLGLQGGGVEEIDQELVGMQARTRGQNRVDDGIGTDLVIGLVDDTDKVHVS
jgi:hypothetical protein